MDEALQSYEEHVRILRNRGKEWNLTDEDIDMVIDESLKYLESDLKSKTKCHVKSRIRFFRDALIIIIGIALIIYLVFSNRKVVHNFFERNIQEIIYPVMKLLRNVMLPIVRSFPALTEWYDEACLVSNPYFKVSDIDCWPCADVRSILNLTLSNLENREYHSGIPFIIKEPNIPMVDFKMLRSTYRAKKKMFDRDAPKMEHFHGEWMTSNDFFEKNSFKEYQSANKDSHITWKLNRLEPTREVRTLFGMPRRVPNYVAGATPEKYILLDEDKGPNYYLPPTEGTTVFVIQGCGARLFVLEPSKECSSSCHRVSVLLKPHHILWYNWWYWRARSIPVEHSAGLSITYLGSYY